MGVYSFFKEAKCFNRWDFPCPPVPNTSKTLLLDCKKLSKSLL